MKKALGKGLNALIPEITDEELKGAIEIKISEIEPNPNQPRKQFNTEKIEALADSIKEHGVIQPIILKKAENGFYQIIAGERRWRAARLAGLKVIPAIIKDYDNKAIMEIALIENLQREDLNPIEEADGYNKLMQEFSMTQEEVARRVGKSRPAVANALRLLNLNANLKKLVVEGKLTEGHARALLVIDDEILQEHIAQTIIQKALSVRQTEALVNNLKSKPEVKNTPKLIINDIELNQVEKNLSNILGTKVNIHHGKNKGKIEIEYYDMESLNNIIEILKYSK